VSARPGDLEAVRRAVYAVLVEEGRGPTVGDLSARTGRPRERVQALLHRLADQHALVLTPSGDGIRMAHPFSAAPMGFVVAPLDGRDGHDGRDDRLWWGGCAWDSFGISAAMGLDVRISTACPGCGRRYELPAGPARAPGTSAVVHFPVPAARWWDDVVHTCSHIRVFCSAEHVRGWAQRTGRPVGAVVPVEDVWRLAQPWYGDRLSDDFVPHTREHNQRLLAEAGLVGGFWALP
jgi:hypothetical protein